MKLTKLLTPLTFVLTLVIMFSGSLVPQANAQIYQSAKTPKYVKSSSFDTVKSRSTDADVRMYGIITNETPLTVDLLVYFGKSTTGRDTTAFARIKPGKIFKFNYVGNRIYRKSASDSVFSQVIIGDVQIGFHESTGNPEYANIKVSNEHCKIYKDELRFLKTESGVITLSDDSKIEYEIYDKEEYYAAQLLKGCRNKIYQRKIQNPIY